MRHQEVGLWSWEKDSLMLGWKGLDLNGLVFNFKSIQHIEGLLGLDLVHVNGIWNLGLKIIFEVG